MAKITEIEKWRMEIDLCESWKEEKFGKYLGDDHSGAGENIDYFDNGFGIMNNVADTEMYTTLNIVHSIVKNIVPALYFQNPKIIAFPKKRESQDTAVIAGQTLNYFYKEMDVEEINQRIIWDAYVLGHGYYKIGYATKFGMDVADKDAQERKRKSLLDKGLEKLGLKKPGEKEEVIHPEINYNIISGRPYVMYLSPFDFGRDPRANTLEESMYWYHKVKRTVKYMKENKKYKNTSKLQGQIPDDKKINHISMDQSQLDDFKTVDLYEIHYRNDNQMYILVISKDGEVFNEHYHEESIYEIDGWQCDELTFNKHGHNSFAISDITKIKNLQDRFTSTIDAILEQVDRFVPKIAFNGGDLTEEGKLALRDGDIGALIETTKNPGDVFKELGFSQFKGDLKALADQILDIVTIQTGLTKAQLLGISAADTATEAQIAQGGQTLRLSDMNKAVNRFAKRQATKLWQIIKQFVELDELELINGVTGIDENTGMPLYNWLNIDPLTSEKLQVGEYDFDIEVGSTQKPDLSVVRKQFENLFSILARTDVIVLMQQQGDKIVLSELLKMYLNLFPEAVKDIGRIIQKITPATSGLVPPEQGPGGTTSGSNFNAMEKMAGMPTPGMPSEISSGG